MPHTTRASRLTQLSQPSKCFTNTCSFSQLLSFCRYDNQDTGFFYEYLALLGTMQPVPRARVRVSWESDLQRRADSTDFRNQLFFSQKQIEKILGWIKEARTERKVNASAHSHRDMPGV